MIERHYDEEALISLLESRREATDTHLPSCPPCTGKLTSFRTIAASLRDADVWDKREIRTEAVPATIATLRAFADRMADEDTRAEAVLTELLAGPRETWMPRLQERPEWRTAGVARKLIEAATRAIDTMPPDAVELTALATEVADHLDVAAYPRTTVAQLRGAAWRDRAYAFYYTGRFSDADAAIFVSERHLSACSVNEYETARLGIVKALVFRAFEKFDAATDAARASAESFERFSHIEKIASARLAEVHLLFSRLEFARAETILQSLARLLADRRESDTYARVLMSLALSQRKLGRFEEAIRTYESAALLFEEMDVPTECARIRWSIALILADAGRLSDAYERLCLTLPEMQRLGMTSEAAYMALDIAELLLAERRYEEVEQVCRTAMAVFENTGVAYTARAMTALAYIKEAAAERRATSVLVRNVRDYIRRLPAQPTLLFAPPPFE
jgi:tetratricopeptide (TPR) repeat protein